MFNESTQSPNAANGLRLLLLLLRNTCYRDACVSPRRGYQRLPNTELVIVTPAEEVTAGPRNHSSHVGLVARVAVRVEHCSRLTDARRNVAHDDRAVLVADDQNRVPCSGKREASQRMVRSATEKCVSITHQHHR